MPNTGDTWGFGWTPDNRIVYVSDQTGDPEVWIMDADGANARPITDDKVVKAVPVVSTDGRYIVYVANPGQGEIVRINIDGSDRTVLANVSGADNPDISPDGKWVIYSAWVEGKGTILRVPIEGGQPQALNEGHATEPRYSRDGSKIACFVLNEKTLNWTRLAIIPAEGGPPIRSFEIPANTNTSRGPIWTPDDKGITVVIAPGERQELWLQPLDGGPGKQITDVGMPGIARREYSRDGRRIAIVRAQGVGNAIMIADYRKQ
jgi:TolB protein